MPDASDIDGCLTSTHGHLGALVDALARADVAAVEAAAAGVAQAAAQLRALGPSRGGTPAHAPAIDDVRWMVERARRLGRPFGGGVAAGAVPAYQPDGRAAHLVTRSSTLEVKG